MATISVIEGGKLKRGDGSGRDQALRRLALQIAIQLPPNPGEAEIVLDYAKTLIRTFVGGSAPL